MPISTSAKPNLIEKIEKLVKKGKLGNELSIFQMEDNHVAPVKSKLAKSAALYAHAFSHNLLGAEEAGEAHWKTTHHIIPSSTIQRLLQTGMLFYLEGDEQEKGIGKMLLTQLLSLSNPIYKKGRKLRTDPEFFLAAIEKLNTERPDKETLDYLALVMKNITWSKANTYIGVSNLSRSRFHGGYDPGSKKLDVHVLRYYRHYLLTLENLPSGLLDPDIETELLNPDRSHSDEKYADARTKIYENLQDLIERCKQFESTVFKPLYDILSSKQYFENLIKLKRSDTLRYQEYLDTLTQCSTLLGEIAQAPLSQIRLNRVSSNLRINKKRNTNEAIFIAKCEEDHLEKLSLSLETPLPLDTSRSSPFEEDLFYSGILEKMKNIEEILGIDTTKVKPKARRNRGEADTNASPLQNVLEKINQHLQQSFILGAHPLLTSEELHRVRAELTEIYQHIRAHLEEAPSSSASSTEHELARVKNKLRRTLNGLEVIIANMERQPAVIATPAAGEPSPLADAQRHSPFPRLEESPSPYSSEEEEEIWKAQKEKERASLAKSGALSSFSRLHKPAGEGSATPAPPKHRYRK